MNRIRNAFTLVELLIVIAILAILAVILFPVFASAKESAKQSLDLNNVRQLSFAMVLYASDNDDYSVVSDHEAGYEWYQPLTPYLKSTDVLRTPAYKADPNGPETDYLINGLFAHGFPLTGFSDPANQIVIGLRKQEYDEIDYHSWPSDGQTWSDLQMYEEDGEDKFLQALFQTGSRKGSNYGFLDGHARNMNWERTLTNSYPGLHNPDQIVPEE